MSRNFRTGEKKVFFMRHGRVLINTDYESLGYEDFMNLLLRRINPPLWQKNAETIATPVKLDVIYPSSSLRARESAEFIQSHLTNYPRIDHSLQELIDEIEFSESIISWREFEERKGLKGCRELILERWFKGENIETFQHSMNRIYKLRQALIENEFKNILIITHGWFLRLVYLYYANKELTLHNLLSAPIVNYGEVLRESLLYPYRFCESVDGVIAKKKEWNGNCRLQAIEPSPLALSDDGLSLTISL